MRRSLAALAVLLAAGCAGGGDERLSLPPGESFAVSTSITPQTAAFGDPVTARLRILLDRDRIDPGAIKVLYRFRPFSDRTTVERVDSGNLTALLYTIELSCLTLFCVPPFDGLEAGPWEARITSGTRPVQAALWPSVRVVSRMPSVREFVPEDAVDVGDWPPKWRATVEVPDPGYRVSPTALTWALGLLGLLLAVSCAAAGWLLFRRGRLLRELQVTPLDRALELLRNARTEEERRAALEALALSLDAELEPTLAEPARALAWSAGAPTEADAEELASLATEPGR